MCSSPPSRYTQLLAVLLSLFALAACSASTTPSQTASEASAHVHTVRCGCAIDSVGKCGNYVLVDDEFLPIAGDVGLGVMEFCGKPDQLAELEGTVVEGAYVATSFALQE